MVAGTFAAAYEQEEAQRQNRDLIDSAQGGLLYQPESEGGVVPYNDFWYERGSAVVASRRTSLIVDPPDGRLPPYTPEGQRRADAQREINLEEQRGHPLADGPEDRGVGDRCILGFNAGPPMLPGAYNQNVQIFSDTGPRRPVQRDDSQLPHHSARRASSYHRSAVVG